MKLAEWSTHPVHLRYAREIHWPSADEDGVDYVLLQLVTDDGLIGVAEGNAKLLWSSVNWRVLCVVLEELLVPLIRNVDLLDERAIARAMSPVREHRTARSMVEAACWDLHAQAQGKPLWQIWGGDPAVPVSWTVTRQAPALMAEEAGSMVDRHGFRNLKVKAG